MRIGNGAADQLQLDIYGEAIDSIYFGDQLGLEAGHAGWRRLSDLLDWLVDNWNQPEEGIWETRGGRQDFTYGRLMCWVALDRGIRLATVTGGLHQWTAGARERNAIYNQIMDVGWSPERQAFLQHSKTDVLDASLLRMPSVGFISPTDPMWLVHTGRDGPRACHRQLWCIATIPAPHLMGCAARRAPSRCAPSCTRTALARAGQLEKARSTFEKMLTYANHLGLYSEEIALTGEQIGNFPQAFTHLALIDAALVLDRRLDHR